MWEICLEWGPENSLIKIWPGLGHFAVLQLKKSLFRFQGFVFDGA